MARHRPTVTVVLGIGLLLTALAFAEWLNTTGNYEAWLRDRRNGGSETRDTIQTFVVALGPGAVSLVIMVAGLVVRTRTVHRVLGAVAFGFIVIQVGVLYAAMRVFGGGPLLNGFTLTGLVGLAVCIAALAMYFALRPKRVSEHERKD